MNAQTRYNDKEYAYSKTIYFLLLLLYTSFQTPSFSQTTALPNDELIVVKLYVDGKSKSYITASWNEEEKYSLRLFEVLDALQFNYVAQWEKHVFTGYPIQENWFRISQDTIYFWDGRTLLHQKMAQWSSSMDLYVTADFLKVFYQVEARFSLSDLAVFIETNNSEPYRLNRERVHKLAQIKKQKEEYILSDVDTLQRANLKINDLTYAFSQNKNLGRFHDYNFNVQGGLRGEMLTGIFNLRFDDGSDNRSHKINDNLRFNWEKLDIKSKVVRSVLVNHDYPTLMTNTYGYASSVTLSNTSKQANLDLAYNYIGKTLPNSNVEIYSNGQIIDYATSDSLGNFKVTLTNTGPESNIKAVAFNSLGIPVTDVQLTYVPYGAIKERQFIYKMTTGITDSGDLFFAPTIEYGLRSWITLFAGNETVLNWGDSSYYRPRKNVLIAMLGAKLSHRKWGIFEIRYLPSQLLRMRYNGYHYGIRTNVTYEHRNTNQTISNSLIKDLLQLNIGGNLPKFMQGNYSLGINYYKYNRYLGSMQSSYLSINMWRKKLTGNFSINTTSNSFDFKNPVFATRFGYYFKNRWYNEVVLEYSTGIKNGFRVGNRLNFQFKNKLTAFANASYQFNGTQKYINIGINWRLPFIQFNTGSYSSPHNTNIYTQLSGSMLFQGGRVSFSSMASTSAALRVSLFVDANDNGVRDKKEPFVKSPKMKLNTANVKTEMNNGILFTQIRPEKPFRLSIPQQRLGDISWQIDDFNLNLMLYPYQCRTLFIPIKVLTEISGQVNCVSKRDSQGVKNIDVVITNTKTGKQVIVTTDEWGSYIYMGLTCGSYTVDLSSETLLRIKLKKKKPNKVHNLNIKPTLEGKQLDGFDFDLIL